MARQKAAATVTFYECTATIVGDALDPVTWYTPHGHARAGHVFHAGRVYGLDGNGRDRLADQIESGGLVELSGFKLDAEPDKRRRRRRTGAANPGADTITTAGQPPVDPNSSGSQPPVDPVDSPAALVMHAAAVTMEGTPN